MTQIMRAFTLVEVLIVVIILAILAGVVVPQFASASDEAYMVAAKGFEQALQSGVSAYLTNQKKFPSTFFQWVAYTDQGSDLDSVKIGGSIRSQLANPSGAVISGDYKTITLQFKNGLTGVYTINDTGQIRATYTGP
jgi:prepilin-type N-terminal cleavage/methylation domain-containing protein